jgi:hypothetical protein
MQLAYHHNFKSLAKLNLKQVFVQNVGTTAIEQIGSITVDYPSVVRER